MLVNQSSRFKWLPVVLIILAGFILRMTLLFVHGTANTPEFFEYDGMARNLLSGKGYVSEHIGGVEYRSFYSGVAYIFLTAGIYYFFSPYESAALFVFQAIASSLLALVIFLMAEKIWNFRVGLLASLMSLMHPGILYYDIHKIHPLSFDAFFISLTAFTLFYAYKSSKSAPLFFSGISLGITILQRTTMSIFFILAIIWLFIFASGDTKKKLIKISFFAIGTMIIIAPMLVRNYAIHKEIQLSSVSAETFWRGNVPWSYGASYAKSGKTVLQSAPENFLGKLKMQDELGQKKLFWEDGIKYVYADPTGFVLKLFKKFFYFWTYSPTTGILYSAKYFYIFFVYYFFIIFLAFVGLRKIIREEISLLPELLLMFFIFIAVSLTHAVLYFELRHRWALEPLILILASIGLLRIFDFFKNTNYLNSKWKVDV